MSDTIPGQILVFHRYDENLNISHAVSFNYARTVFVDRGVLTTIAIHDRTLLLSGDLVECVASIDGTYDEYLSYIASHAANIPCPRCINQTKGSEHE